MVKTVELEYSSIGSALMILIIIIIGIAFIYLMCAVFSKGVSDIVPQSIQNAYNHFLVKQFYPDVNYIIHTGTDYLDDSRDYIYGKPIGSKAGSANSPASNGDDSSNSPASNGDDSADSPASNGDGSSNSPASNGDDSADSPASNGDGASNSPASNGDGASNSPASNGDGASPLSIDCPTKLMRRGNQIILLNENVPEVPGKNPIYFDTLDDYIYYMQVERAQTGKKCPILYLKEDDATVPEVPTPTPDTSQANAIAQYFQPTQTPQQLLQSRMPSINNPYQPYYRPCPLYNTPLPNAANIALATVPMTPVSQVGPAGQMQQPLPIGPAGQMQRPLPVGPAGQMQRPLPVGPAGQMQRPMVPYTDANRQMNPNGTYGFDPSGQYVGKYTVLDQIHNSTKIQYPSGMSANAMDPNWGGAVFTSKKLYEGDFAGNNVTQPSPTLTNSPSSAPSGAIPFFSATGLMSSPSSATIGAIASSSAMDPNWGGVSASRAAVNQGDFNGDAVSIQTA